MASNLNICPYINTSNVYNFKGVFESCGSLTTVPLLDLSSATDCKYMFNGCSNLRYLGGFKGLKVDLDLSDSPLLVRQSVLNVLNNLADVTELGTNPKLLLDMNTRYKLTSKEIAIGTNKGWAILVNGGSN
jgi:hypothetical protein